MNVDHKKDELGEYAVVQIGNFYIHLNDEDGDVKIHIKDHANITIKGEPKECPTLVVDSEEFPTQLDVWDTEGAFK